MRVSKPLGSERLRRRGGMSRRHFLQDAAIAAGVVSIQPQGILTFFGNRADLILRNGKIYTMYDHLPLASAIAVRDGKILAVGENKEIDALGDSSTKIIDLKGQSVSPGIIDAHSHPMAFGHMELDFVILRPPQVNSFDTLRNVLAKAAKDKPAGEWIVGRGFDRFKEGRFPTRRELDQAAPNNPLLIIHWGGQFGAANTLALKEANLLNKDVPDPYGGKFLREKNTGLPNGVLIHYPAIYAVHQPEEDEDSQFESARWAFKEFARVGVTCVHDNFCVPRHAPTYAKLDRAGQLDCRLRVYTYINNLENVQKMTARMRRYEGRMARLQGIKLAVDGYALMYDILPEHRHLAIPMHPQPLFESIIATIHNAGFQADVHAVGDKGVDWTLEAFLKASGSLSACRERRHRIEHFPFRKIDSIKKTAESGIPVCTQPLYIELKAEDFTEHLPKGSAAMIEGLVPARSFLKEGVPLCFGADVPAFPSHRPLDSLRCVVDRKTESGRALDSSESISFLEALKAHTLGSAYASFDEKQLGSLEKGKEADFVIWSKDLGKIQKGDDMADLNVISTWVAGRMTFDGGEA